MSRPVSLHSLYAVDPHLVKEKVLCEEPTANRKKSLELRKGTRISIVLSDEK
jgi:hypothetical protein